ncbi:hypothetical protein TorRG33x02_329490, partial [Trema orientale]
VSALGVVLVSLVTQFSCFLACSCSHPHLNPFVVVRNITVVGFKASAVFGLFWFILLFLALGHFVKFQDILRGLLYSLAGWSTLLSKASTYVFVVGTLRILACYVFVFEAGFVGISYLVTVFLDEAF